MMGIQGSPVGGQVKQAGDDEVALICAYEQRAEGYDGTCLRRLGLCELGGCCDTCWYRPNHPRFRERSS